MLSCSGLFDISSNALVIGSRRASGEMRLVDRMPLISGGVQLVLISGGVQLVLKSHLQTSPPGPHG
jgi:hypothetical protein